WGSVPEEVGMQKFPYIVPLIVVCMASWVSQGAAQDKKLEKIRIATAALKGDFSRGIDIRFFCGSRGEQRNGDSKIGCVVFAPSRSILKTNGKGIELCIK